MCHQELLSQRLGEIALGAFEFACESCDQFGNGLAIIDVTRSQAKGHQFALIIDDQVQLEAVEPAHRRLATCSPPSTHPVLVNAWVATDRKGGGVDEADAATAA